MSYKETEAEGSLFYSGAFLKFHLLILIFKSKNSKAKQIGIKDKSLKLISRGCSSVLDYMSTMDEVMR